MFSKLLGKKKESIGKENQEKAELLKKISTMNLTEMRSYINNKIEALPLCEDGLNGVILKLITPDSITKHLYIKENDMDSKKKKAFDLVILISKNKKITFKTVDAIGVFIELYASIIKEYDTQYKEIYTSRFKDAITIALSNINTLSDFKAKMNLLGES